ncbi:MAG: hypothetical protein WCK28_01080 [Burkholderiales bacterium]|jgi:hypothetical protein
MNQSLPKFSLIAVAVSAALAACGGGGGGDGTTTTTSTSGTTTTGTTTTGQTLTANTGTSSGASSNDTGPVQVGLPAVVPVPAANIVATSVPTSTYGGQAITAYNSVNDWRGQMRIESGGTFGVGLLAQNTSLDAAAAAIKAAQPNLFSTDASARAAALAAAQAQVPSGFAASYVLTGLTNDTTGITPGAFCAKTLFSALPGIELATSGVRSIGLSVPSDSSGCVAIAALDQLSTWQLPPTGSSSVYPFPGKQLTLWNYYGDYAALDSSYTSVPGHSVLASLASNDALPVAIPGIGSPIATSQITINEFTLRPCASVSGTCTPGNAVAARVYTQAGVVAGSGVTLRATNQLRFPTSILLVPDAPLTTASRYTATIRATVKGRTVTRTWEFTTA